MIDFGVLFPRYRRKSVDWMLAKAMQLIWYSFTIFLHTSSTHNKYVRLYLWNSHQEVLSVPIQTVMSCDSFTNRYLHGETLYVYTCRYLVDVRRLTLWIDNGDTLLTLNRTGKTRRPGPKVVTGSGRHCHFLKLQGQYDPSDDFTPCTYG